MADEKVVERLQVQVSPRSVEIVVLDSMRQEKARQDIASQKKNKKAMEGFYNKRFAWSAVSFEKRMQWFAFVRTTSQRVL